MASLSLRWRHNDDDSVSNHQPHDCLPNCLLGRTSKKTSKFRVTGLCVGKSPGPVNSPHKGPVTRKMSPFDDVIMMPSTCSKCFAGVKAFQITANSTVCSTTCYVNNNKNTEALRYCPFARVIYRWRKYLNQWESSTLLNLNICIFGPQWVNVTSFHEW